MHTKRDFVHEMQLVDFAAVLCYHIFILKLQKVYLMNPGFSVWEAVLYTFLNSFPYMLLVLFSFRGRWRFGTRITVLLLIFATISQVSLNTFRFFSPQVQNPLYDAVISVIYIGFIFLAIRERFGKLVFTVLVLMDLGNLVVVTSKFIEGIFFPEEALLRYHFTYSLFMMPVEALLIMAVYLMILKGITADSEPDSELSAASSSLWWFLWLVPGVFYLIWTQHFYTSGKSALENALDPLSTGYLLLIDIGSVVIYRIIVQLVTVYEKNARLTADNHELELQKMQYDTINERIEDMRRTNHDLRHHVLLLKQIRETGNLSALDGIIASYPASLIHDQPLRYCENDTVNAVLTYFSEIALKNGIDYTVNIVLSEKCFIEKPDLAVMFGNIIENAVEACKFIDEKRYIKITGSHSSSPEQLSFIVENNYKVEPHTNDKGVFLSTKHKGNGIGINSVRHIVGKYQGESSFMPDNGVFKVSVLICK